MYSYVCVSVCVCMFRVCVCVCVRMFQVCACVCMAMLLHCFPPPHEAVMVAV